MPKSKIDANSIRLDLRIDQDTDIVDLEISHNLSATMEEAQVMFYLDAINGLTYKIKCEIETLAFQGALLREVATLREIIDDEDDDVINQCLDIWDYLLSAQVYSAIDATKKLDNGMLH